MFLHGLRISPRFYPLIRLCFLFLLASPLLRGQDKALQDVEQALVQVNITTETVGAPELVVATGGKILQDYRPRIIELFPSIGMVIDDKGHVLAYIGYRWVNIHARNPRIEILDHEGRKYPAKLVGIDQNLRVAVVQCQDNRLRRAPLCEGCEIRDAFTVVMPVLVGSRVAQFQSAQALSIGTGGRSSTGGDWAIQVSDPLSVIGAPMLNERKQIIGIVADQQPLGPSQANRIALTTVTIPQLLSSANKIIKAGGDILTGWLGVSFDAENTSTSGVMIDQIEEDSPAFRAGLRPRDIMLKWNKTNISDVRKLIQMVQDTPIGSRVSIAVLRDGQPLAVTALIEARRPRGPSERPVIDVPAVVALQSARFAPRSIQLQSSLGIDGIPITPELADFFQLPVHVGILIAAINKESVFDRAGILPGDIVLNADGLETVNLQVLYDHIRSRGLGNRLVLQVLRKGARMDMVIQLPRQLDPVRKY